MDINEIFDLFIDFIKIPSVSGEELPAIEFLENILEKHSIKSERYCKDENRPNLVACLKAENPTEMPMVLISHIDVVPAKDSEWKHPPFSAQIDEGRVFGRGTLDTKHLTMMQLYAFLNMRGKNLNRDVYFVATSDEEKGSEFGMQYLAKTKPELFKNAIVLNEGGGFPLLIDGKNYIMMTVGEKAVCKIKIIAKGDETHFALACKESAMDKIANALGKIFENEAYLQKHGSYIVRNLMENIMQTKTPDNTMARDLYNYSSQNSIGMREYCIGEQGDYLQSEVSAMLEFKVMPDISAQTIQNFVNEVCEGVDVSFELVGYEKGFVCSNEHIEQMRCEISQIAKKHGGQYEVLPMMALGRTDGRFFGEQNSFVYGLSPVLSEDSFDIILPKVHGANESIAIDSFMFGANVINDYLHKNCL